MACHMLPGRRAVVSSSLYRSSLNDHDEVIVSSRSKK